MTYVIVADDLTGACDTGIAMRSANEPVHICLCEKAQVNFGENNDSIWALITNSRAFPPAQAYKRTYELVAQLVQQADGPFLLYKKIDSMFRGNTAIEVEAAATAAQCDCVLMVPSTPIHGRVVKNGRLYAETLPAKGMNLVSQLLLPSAPEYKLLPLDIVRSGVESLNRHLTSLRSQGVRRILVDCVTQTDLNVVAQAVKQQTGRIMLCGTSGFASALAQVRGGEHAETRQLDFDPPILFSLGSCHSATRQQCAEFLRLPETAAVWISAENCCHGNWREEASRAISQCEEILKNKITGLVVATDSLQHGSSPAPSDEGSIEEISNESIVRALAEVISTLLKKHSFGAMVLSGGDTARHILSGCGAERMELQQELLPGMPLSIAVLEDGCMIPVVTKSGGFGQPEAFGRIIEILTGRTVMQEVV